MGPTLSMIAFSSWIAAAIFVPLAHEDPPPDLVPVASAANPTACGPAVASVVCDFFGKNVSEPSLTALVDESKETSFLQLFGYLQEHGLVVRAVETTPEQLSQRRGIAILQLDAPRLSDEQASKPTHHFVVAIADGSGSIRIVDSTIPPDRQNLLNTEHCLRQWTGNALLVDLRSTQSIWVWVMIALIVGSIVGAAASSAIRMSGIDYPRP